ncbi:MAG: hypothetical protein GF418_03965 [Chitinivibrionales bacterium]|nr:hypothetical protein [Chitinivibrionales bacterium]MBD3394762.1 hypothetical protein [Chitinivibrionales bacterium]
MTRIFPGAKDYKTMVVKIGKEERGKIEETLGWELLPGQRETFQYFDMLDAAGTRIGTIIAASQKGEYGAIEFVVGIDTKNTVCGLYIQRSRERNRAFKERAFLDLFVGKKIVPLSGIDEAYKGKESPGTNAVIRGLKKEFAAYDMLVSK